MASWFRSKTSGINWDDVIGNERMTAEAMNRARRKYPLQFAGMYCQDMLTAQLNGQDPSRLPREVQEGLAMSYMICVGSVLDEAKGQRLAQCLETEQRSGNMDRCQPMIEEMVEFVNKKESERGAPYKFKANEKEAVEKCQSIEGDGARMNCLMEKVCPKQTETLASCLSSNGGKVTACESAAVDALTCWSRFAVLLPEALSSE